MAPSTGANGDSSLNAVQTSAKAGHINMMDDTVIANLPASGLRAVLRGLLGTDESFVMTKNFQELAKRFLDASRPATIPPLFEYNFEPKLEFDLIQSRYRCLMGCGRGFESVDLLTTVVQQFGEMQADLGTVRESIALSAIDGDVVQVVTSVQKELTTSSGMREKTEFEIATLEKLRDALLTCKKQAEQSGGDFPFERGYSRLQMFNGVANAANTSTASASDQIYMTAASPLESVKLGEALVPRMFMGLWQFSSPAWGSASRSKINKHFRKHVDCGFTAYDMADHYGDAETTFVRLSCAMLLL
jgi:hypothetical protein